jgi:hypothetical protein
VGGLSGLWDYCGFYDDAVYSEVQVDQPGGRIFVCPLWFFDRGVTGGRTRDHCFGGCLLFVPHLRETEVFDILEVDASSKYLRLFLDFHAQKIAQLCPGYAFKPDADTVSFFILRNMSIAGLFGAP